MRSRLCALSALLASVGLAAAAECDDIKTSVAAKIEASAAPAAGTQEANNGRPVESARGAGQKPIPVTSRPPSVSENWESTATLTGHKDLVKSLAFSPDGKRLFSASFDGEIKVWDTKTRKQLASIIAHRGALMALIVSPSGEFLCSAGAAPGEVTVWDLRTLKPRMTLSYPHPVYCLAFSRDSELVAAAGEHEVFIWSLRDGERKHELAVGMWPITGLAFSRDARVLYVGGYPDMGAGQTAAKSGIVRVWDYSTGAKLGEIGLPHPVDGIDLSHDGRTLAVSAVALHAFDVAISTRRVSLTSRFSALDQQLRGGSPIFQEQFRGVALSPDANIIAGAAGSPGPLAPEAGHVALFARSDGRRVARLQAPRLAKGEAQIGEHDIGTVAFSPDGKLLASGGNERNVELWLAPAAK